MFRNVNSFIGYTVSASDGDAGTLLNLLFDEETWTVRYLAVRAGNWFLRQPVLISPIALHAVLDDKRVICLREKKSMIANSPLVSMNRPVSRRFEERYYSYYGWPVYWGQKNRWGTELYPSGLFPVAPLNIVPRPPGEARRDTHLRSTRELEGFSVYGGDGKIGTVKDCIINDLSWEVRYILVDAAEIGKQSVLISPHWLAGMSIAERVVTADVSVRAVRDAPDYRGTGDINRDYELQLFSHYDFLDEIDAIRVRQKVMV